MSRSALTVSGRRLAAACAAAAMAVGVLAPAPASARAHTGTASPSTSTWQTGAINDAQLTLKRVDAIVCGKVRGHWIAGTLLRHSLFLTFTQEAHNYGILARRAKGRARKQDLSLQARYSKLNSAHAAACAAPPTAPPAAPPAAGQLHFAINGAIGLALADTSTTPSVMRAHAAATTAPSSNLEAISPTDQLSSAVSSGTAQVQTFLIAPNNTVYVVFANSTYLSNPSSTITTASPAPAQTGCILAEVDPTTGTPTCIDTNLMNIGMEAPSNANENPPVQFDDSGAIYYAGRTTDNQYVLRKYFNGQITDLAPSGITIQNFLVLDDGSVLITGVTNATHTLWTRTITPSGSLVTLSGTAASFLTVFPDGNAYFSAGVDNGVERYMTATDTLDPEYWIANDAPAGEHFNAQTICGAAQQSGAGFCYGGSWVTWSYASPDGHEYVVDGSAMLNTQLMEYYPAVSFLQTQVQQIGAALGVGNDLVLAGTDASGTNILTLLDPSTGNETQLLGVGEQVEIYHLAYRADDNSVLFDGLRFSDNQYVVGEVNLTTHQVTYGATSTADWSDVQTFAGN